MAKPPPETGLVVRYDFLWNSEKEWGREEGSKTRPCAVVLATASGRVVVCGITHTDPGHDAIRVEPDARTKAALGLDSRRQWIHCGEINELVTWDDPGVEPLPSGAWAYGYLRAADSQQMLDKVKAQQSAEQLKWIPRAC